MNYINKLIVLINKKKKSLKKLENKIQNYLNENNEKTLFSLNNNLINSFISIKENKNYKIIRKYVFDNLIQKKTPLMEIFNTEEAPNNEKYINTKIFLNIYYYLESDNNYVLETYEYVNNKLKAYHCQDIDNIQYYKTIYNNLCAKIKNEDNNLLNVNKDYFDEEFNILNIFNKKDSNYKFGDYLKDLWTRNSVSKEHNLFEPLIHLLILRITNINNFINQTKHINENILNMNIKKELNLNDEFKLIMGDLNMNVDEIKYDVLNHIFVFFKLLLMFLCKLENTNVCNDQKYIFKYENDKENNIVLNDFIKNVKNSFDLVNIDNVKSDKYNKIVSEIKSNKVLFSIKIILFNNFFEYILNNNYYEYKDERKFKNYLKHMVNVKNIIKCLVPKNWKENDLKTYNELRVLLEYIDLDNFYKIFCFDNIDIY